MTPPDTWQAVRDALAGTSERLSVMLSACRPTTMVTANWTVADTAAHVVFLADWYRALFTGAGADFVAPPIHETTVDTVCDVNAACLAIYAERDLDVLRTTLVSAVQEVLAATATWDPTILLPWLGSAQVPLAGVFAHLVNEMHVHGRDIARSSRLLWSIPKADAALFFELFVVGVVAHDSGHLLESRRPPAERRIAVEFRSRHTTPVTIVAENGRTSVEAPGSGADVVVSFDPAGLNQMLFHRISPVRAAATGKVLVRGPRPWLLPLFMRTVRMP